MTPKLEWLEAFAEFGVDLNFTHAAKRLHMSQPALHSQIRRLAEVLNVSLYQKQGRKLVLTRAGVRTLLFARQMREHSTNFVERLRDPGPAQSVVLAAGEGTFLYLVGPALRAFVKQDAAPLRLLTRNAAAAIEALRRGEAHLAVAAVTEPPPGLHGQILAEVRHVAVFPRSHPLAARKKLCVADLASEPLVVPPSGSRLREAMFAAMASQRSPPKVAVEASGWEPMLHFVSLGLGIAVVNGCCRLPRGLVGVPVGDLPRVRYYLMHNANGLEHEAVTRLRDQLLELRERWRSSSRLADPALTASP